MENGFRKGKIPQRFDGMTDEQILSKPVQHSTGSWIEEVDNQIVGYINLYYDTELAAVQIIKKIERLEKALDKACEVLEEVYVPSCDSDVRRHNQSAKEWKEWCKKDA